MVSKDLKMMIIIISSIVIIWIFWIYQNNYIIITEVNYKNSKIPQDFNGYTIAHISDLHNKRFGKDQRYLLKEIKSISPDIIVITGDLIDRRRYNLDIAMSFIKGAVNISPVYYVSGNHEAWSGDYDNIKNQLLDKGVKTLDDDKLDLVKNKSNIEIIGLSDPAFIGSDNTEGSDYSNLERKLKTLSNESVFQILLCHRPELFHIYAEEKIDLIFSGHAHGGQFRIPFVGGLFAPNQGLFPEYTSGIHVLEESSMFVSRGLGNSIIPIRIFNRPEIGKIVLENIE